MRNRRPHGRPVGRRGGGIGRLFYILILAGCGGGVTPAPPPSPGQGPRTGSPSPSAHPATGAAQAGVEIHVDFLVINDSLPDDHRLASLVEPFRERMGNEIREVIGEAAVTLSKAVPEGNLGNFSADAMLWAAERSMGEPVQMALTNNGGLRVPIPAGPITVGQIFELMPFDNMLSVLTLSGDQVQALADGLAARRGEPIAGFSFRIEAQGDTFVARELLVGGEAVEPGRLYRLVTNDYLANGGEAPAPIHEPLAREDLPVLLRDAFIDYIREMGVIRGGLEGRITGGILR